MSVDGDTRVERLLGWVHVAVAILLLPLTALFGLWLAPVLAAGPFWLAGAGVRLLRGTDAAWTFARRTHLFVGPVLFALFAYGVYTQNAATGGTVRGRGLLSPVGYYPLVAVLALGSLSAVTLVLSWRRGRTLPDRQP